MARILIIQPHKMLQQAIVVALFPEHQVQVLEKIPPVEPAAGADLVIVDADLPAAGLRMVESWRLPVIFMSAGLGDKAGQNNSKRLIMPIKRDDLKAAIAEVLRLTNQSGSSSAGPVSPVAGKKKTSAAAERVTPDNRKEVIELTDVIEETPGYDSSEMGARNKV